MTLRLLYYRDDVQVLGSNRLFVNSNTFNFTIKTTDIMPSVTANQFYIQFVTEDITINDRVFSISYEYSPGTLFKTLGPYGELNEYVDITVGILI
jgi:hypothetical protein